MTAFSNEQMIVLAGVVTKQVRNLLEIVSQNSILITQFVESQFTQQACNFPETVKFLEEIGWIKKVGNVFALTEDGDAACRTIQYDTQIRKAIIEALIGPKSPYRDALADYVMRFQQVNTELVYQSPITDRLQESPVRNLLIDLRAVEYRAGADIYALLDGGIDLYVWAKNFKNSTSRKSMEVTHRRREELGYAAELAVLAYEKERVGHRWASKVEHVSSDTPFASYDIKSVTVCADTATPRFIEVKAVPGESRQFYWTASEVEVARLLRERYFLYLLPVIVGRGFDLGQLMTIANPWSSIRENSNEWLIEENVIVCKRKP